MQHPSALTFVAPSSFAFGEASPIFSPLALGHSTLDCSPVSAGSLGETAKARIRHAYEALKRPCFAIESAILPHSLDDQGGCGELWHDGSRLTEREFCREYAGLAGVVSQVLAYTADGESVSLFRRDMPGRVGDEPRGGDGVGFDRIWIPHGYTKTYAELHGAKLALNKRKRLFFDLAEHLDLPVKNDIYEVHVTVDDTDEETFRRFKSSCAELGLKAIQIELPRGMIPTHLITASFHRGTFEAVHGEADNVCRLLAERGFKVTRMKIECTVANTLVPVEDDDGASREPSNYFEFHVKVPVHNDEDATRAKAICRNYTAYLSRNPSNRMSDGTPLRFCTMRVRGRGSRSANASFDRFLQELRDAGFKLSNILREYTLFDSNLSLDDGWTTSLDQTKNYCFSECASLRGGACPFAEQFDYIPAPA